MRRNKTATIINSYQKDLRVPSPDVGIELKLQSKSKVPRLQDVIDQWKFQQHVNQSDLDLSLLTPDSSTSNINGFIEHLTKKISLLQNKLKVLSSKHLEICTILCQQLEKRASAEVMLRRQNIQLNKEMKIVLDDMKQIIDRLYSEGQIKRKSQIDAQLKKDKENIQPFGLHYQIDEKVPKTSREKRLVRKPRLLSNRSKFNSKSSVSRLPFQKDEPNKAVEAQYPRKGVVNHDYYSRNQQVDQRNRSNLRNQVAVPEKNRYGLDQRKIKTRETQSYY